jgi:hypothetical protein
VIAHGSRRSPETPGPGRAIGSATPHPAQLTFAGGASPRHAASEDVATPDEIAMLASMTPRTVDAHLASARRKLAAVTTEDAVAAAAAWGLLDASPPADP